MARIKPTNVEYKVPLDIRQWYRLNDQQGVYDQIRAHGEFSLNQGNPEIKKLLEAGCTQIHWNEHFGNNLYFRCPHEFRKGALKAVRKFLKHLSK